MHSQPSVVGEPPEQSEPSVSAATDIISQTVGGTTPAEKSPSRRGVQARPQSKSRDLPHHKRRPSFSRSDSSPCDAFFASEPPPPNVATAGLRVRQFIRPLQEQEELSTARVAIVTSGGTDVPLEVNRQAFYFLLVLFTAPLFGPATGTSTLCCVSFRCHRLSACCLRLPYCSARPSVT